MNKVAMWQRVVLILQYLRSHKHLNKHAEAMRQGVHRLERGRNFYKTAQQAAEARGIELKWSIYTVKGVLLKAVSLRAGFIILGPRNDALHGSVSP